MIGRVISEEYNDADDETDIEIQSSSSSSLRSPNGITVEKLCKKFGSILLCATQQIWSILFLSILLTVFLVTITGVTINFIGSNQTTAAVSENTENIHRLMIDNVKNYIDSLFVTFSHIPLTIESNFQGIWIEGNETKAKGRLIRILFSECVSLYINERVSVMVGYTNGIFNCVSRIPDNRIRYEFTDFELSQTRYIIMDNRTGVLTDSKGMILPFPLNAVSRDWYTVGASINENERKVSYTDVYVNVENSLAIGASTPLYFNGSLVGVASALLEFTGPQGMSGHIKESLKQDWEKYKFLIVERNGYIVASSFEDDIDYFNRTTREKVILHEHPLKLFSV